VRFITKFAAVVLLGFCSSSSFADVFPMPPPGEDMIGAITTVTAGPDDTLIDIARAHDLGYDEIRAANPAVDSWMPRADTTIVLPKFYLLPAGPREGVVINVAEMRMYYFPKAKPGQPAMVETYPVSIGRGDWNTPLVTTRISSKVVDPTWTPPKSIRAEHAENGDPLPEKVKPGPDNPLGKYALRMTLPSYLIHGTNNEYGIGMQVTHGCMRLYPEDIERLYRIVPVGTPVRIINQRYKAGWHQGMLYLEAHPPLEGPHGESAGKTPMVEALTAATKAFPTYAIDWHQVDVTDLESSGIPAPVGALRSADPVSAR
jgi:L,D-transpeptidase ErfK/SrfK